MLKFLLYYAYMASEQEKIQRQFGREIKEKREALNLTQADIADKAGVSVNYYARVERGEENPTLKKIQGIKKALGIKSKTIL